MNSNSQVTPTNWATDLLDLMVRVFDAGDMSRLAYDFGMDFDDFAIGRGKSEKTIEFIQKLARQQRIPELIERCAALRPGENWQPLLEAAKQEPLRFDGDSAAGMETAVSTPTSLSFLLQNKLVLGGIAGLALIVIILFMVIFWPKSNTEGPEVADVLPPTNSPTATNELESVEAAAGIPEPANTPAPSRVPSPTPGSDATKPSEIASSDSRLVRSTDGMEMVLVPAGTFLMGSDPAVDPQARDDELPQHEVTLDSFWIDRTEVTNQMYEQCVAAGACETANFADEAAHNGANYPVVGVSWFDAQNYCTWAGGSLPTEAQWEYAARGSDGRIYPWGNDLPSCDVVGGCGDSVLEVASYSPASDSWVGAADMSGNVWEWVADWYDFNYYQNSPSENPTGPSSGQFKVYRGGNYSLHLSIAYRSNGRPNESYYSDRGFRCVLPTD